MKGWTSSGLTLFLPHPVNDHWLFAGAPITQCPGMVSSTNAGPALPLAIAEQLVGSRWKRNCWTKAPDQIYRIRRRKEHTGVDVAQPERAWDSRSRRWLVN